VVPRYAGCFPTPTPREDCSGETTNDTKNTTLSLRGSGVLEVSGIVYAPSDQVEVNSSNTTQDGTIGQLIVWTVDYSGNADLNQLAFTDDTPGILRLDAACSRAETCNP